MIKQHPLATGFIAETELLAQKHNCILWAMDSSFSRELYISGTFRSLTGRAVCEMYQNQSHADFEKNFNAITKEHCFGTLQNRLINPKYTGIYHFKLPDGSLQLVQDRSFHLNDDEGNCLLIGGVALPITESDLLDPKQNEISDQIDQLTIEFYRILSLPLSIPLATSAEPFNVLTEKQHLIFKHILHGLTAKEIAKKLDLSFRTVELHTDNIKKALGAKSKSELISIAISNNHVAIRL